MKKDDYKKEIDSKKVGEKDRMNRGYEFNVSRDNKSKAIHI
jgi:hypothetical protein